MTPKGKASCGGDAAVFARLLDPYRDARGGHRCPCCDAPIRVIADRIVGCPDARDLERLARSCADGRIG